MAPVAVASGKTFGKSQNFVAVRRSYGKYINGCTAHRKRNLVINPYSESELQNYAKFRTSSHLIATARLDPDNEYNWRQRWSAVKKVYPTFNGYLFAQAMAGHINTDGTYKA